MAHEMAKTKPWNQTIRIWRFEWFGHNISDIVRLPNKTHVKISMSIILRHQEIKGLILIHLGLNVEERLAKRKFYLGKYY